MAEYIDVEALKEALLERGFYPAIVKRVLEKALTVDADIGYMIHKRTTADAATVKHGRWELHGDDDDLSASYFCSVCGYNMDEDEYLDRFSSYNYCPNCGAKMDAEG